MKKLFRLAALGCCLAVLLGLLVAVPAAALAGPTLRTTLTDNSIQRGSKRTFDVWARNAGGEKIRATVRHNGETLEPTWNDDEKASYTLHFTEEGENLVTVSASSDGGKRAELTYHITYRPAEAGEEIGRAIWSVELFTVGGGYLIAPTEVPIYEGETSAEQLLRLLSENGLVGYYGGSVKSAFYLAYIADGTAAGETYNNYRRSDPPANPRGLGLNPEIPDLLVPYLEENMTYYDPDDYAKNSAGYLGEFAFTNGSGWMYAVNNVFPNVGFADCYLSDGDVVRVQFTLGYGADIGGAAALGTEADGSGYYAVANKDALTREICNAQKADLLAYANVSDAYRAALAVMATLDATQEAADAAASALADALKHPEAPEPTEPSETTEAPEVPETPEVPEQPKTTEAPERIGGCFASATPWAAVWLVPAAGLVLAYRRKRM